MYVHHVHIKDHSYQNKGVGTSGTEVVGNCDHADSGNWLNLGCLRDQLSAVGHRAIVLRRIVQLSSTTAGPKEAHYSIFISYSACLTPEH